MAIMGTMVRVGGALASASVLAGTPPAGLRAEGTLAHAAPLVDRAATLTPMDRLSVLTYNVHGLPAILRKSDVAPLSAISDRLADLRRRGRQPGVVVLQEAFTDDAKRIGVDAGYRYVVTGPGIDERGASPPSDRVTEIDRSTHWWVGEGMGKHVDSGLMVLSDYPVVGIRRLAFAEGACAGIDCLSNKGALLVTVSLPGHAAPIDIATTHFNSRGSAGVSASRSLVAFRRQVSALLEWVERERHPERPLVVAGDFNVGKARERRAAFFSGLALRQDRLPLRDAVADYARGSALPECAREARDRAKDWQLWQDGRSLRLKPVAVEVPFGHEADGSMLSDHIGFAVQYRLLPASDGQGR